MKTNTTSNKNTSTPITRRRLTEAEINDHSTWVEGQNEEVK